MLKKFITFTLALGILLVPALLLLTRNNTEAQTPTYTFDVRRNNQSIREVNDGGPVNVAINVNANKNLKNIKVTINGVEKSEFGKTANGSGRHVIGTINLNGAGQTFKFRVRATTENGTAFNLKSVDGPEFIDVKVKGTSSGSGSGGGGGSGSAGGSSSTSSAEAAAAEAVTLKPKLTVAAGPDPDLPNSSTGTVNGENIKGGVVFTVKFKRPKTENYDLKTMHVVVTKDGQPRFTIFKSPETNYQTLTVKEEGDFKIYTFKRNYQTINKPNGRSTWQANFVPIVASPAGDTQSEPLVLNINNPDSTAEATCRELKAEVNNWFARITEIIDKNQLALKDVNDRIDRKYQELNLAATNPIPDYNAKKIANDQKSRNVDTKQTELEALRLTCEGDNSSVEDVGAKVAAFKVKSEEAKSAMAAYRDGTLNLLGELRTRLPQDGDDDGPTIPAGFVKYKTPCYSFAARRGFTISDPAIELKGACNKQVSFEKQQSDGLTLAGRISPVPWPVTNGTLAQNVQQVRNAEVANGREIVDERSFQLDGRNAVRFISRANIPVGTEGDLHVLVESPYKINGSDVSGYDIFVAGYNFTGNSNNVSLGNFVKNTADKALATWQWKENNTGGGNDGAVPPGFVQASTKCFTLNIPKKHKLVNVYSDQEDRTFNCLQTQQFENNEGTKIDLLIASGTDFRSTATAQGNMERFLQSEGLVNNPAFTLNTQNLTVDGIPAIKLDILHIASNTKYMAIFLMGPTYNARGTERDSALMKGALLFTKIGRPDGAKDRFAQSLVEPITSSWKWKPGGFVGTFDFEVPVPADELSQVACTGNGKDGPRVEVIYLKNEGQEGVGLDQPVFATSGLPLTTRQFVKQASGRLNRLVIESAQRQDGFRQIRFKTNPNCEVAVREITLATADQSPNIGVVYGKLISKYGLHNKNTKYLVYWSDTNLSDGVCGLGGVVFKPGEQPSDAEFTLTSHTSDPNVNVWNNNSGIGIFRKPCWGRTKTSSSNPGDTVLHELMHTLGAVLRGSPNSNFQGNAGINHCNDENDVMCYKESVPLKLGVCPKSFEENLLDCKGDDYFNLRPRTGSFLSENWNTANSKWFTSAKGSNQR